MYHAACKAEFQPFNRSYSQLAFFNFLQKHGGTKYIRNFKMRINRSVCTVETFFLIK